MDISLQNFLYIAFSRSVFLSTYLIKLNRPEHLNKLTRCFQQHHLKAWPRLPKQSDLVWKYLKHHEQNSLHSPSTIHMGCLSWNYKLHLEFKQWAKLEFTQTFTAETFCFPRIILIQSANSFDCSSVKDSVKKHLSNKFQQVCVHLQARQVTIH